jgi:hypothetical protein
MLPLVFSSVPIVGTISAFGVKDQGSLFRGFALVNNYWAIMSKPLLRWGGLIFGPFGFFQFRHRFRFCLDFSAFLLQKRLGFSPFRRRCHTAKILLNSKRVQAAAALRPRAPPAEYLLGGVAGKIGEVEHLNPPIICWEINFFRRKDSS